MWIKYPGGEGWDNVGGLKILRLLNVWKVMIKLNRREDKDGRQKTSWEDEGRVHGCD